MYGDGLMSEIRSVELVMVDGRLTMFTKINGVPQSEHSSGYHDADSALRYGSLLDALREHLGIEEPNYDE